MIGNSPRSDILAARAAGLRAVFIPHPYTWSLEEQEIDPADRGVLHLARFPELLEPLLTPPAPADCRSCTTAMWTGAAARPRPSRPSSAGTCGPSPVCSPAPASGGCAGRDGCPPPPFPWHYWWQAHLLDCLVDAQLRDPRRGGAATIATLTRSVRLRNGGPLDQPVLRRRRLARPRRPTRRARWPATTGCWARSSGSCTAGGPKTAAAASGGARRGRGRPGQERARQRARRDPAGPRRPDRVRRRDHRLDRRDPRRPRHRPRPRRGAAGPRRLGPRGRPPHLHLLPGRAPRRVRRAGRPRRPPALGRPRGRARRRRDPPPRPPRRRAARLRRRRRRAVRGHPRALPRGGGAAHGPSSPPPPPASCWPAPTPCGRAGWTGRSGPVFSAEWSRPARTPRRGVAEADLSVQLSGWMVLEAAARLPRS